MHDQKEDVMELKPGSRWQSVCCTTQAVVVKVPEGDHVLACGGHAMVPFTMGGEVSPTESPLEGFAEGTVMGKRYRDDERGVEILCTKAGEGSLSLDGIVVPAADTKALPASD